MLVAQNVAGQLERRIAFRKAIKQTIQRTIKAGAKGVKIQVSGRLGGSEMSRTEWDKEGRIPLGTLRADISYGVVHARTTYGAIGVKVWVYRGEQLGEPPRHRPAPSHAPRAARRRRRDAAPAAAPPLPPGRAGGGEPTAGRPRERGRSVRPPTTDRPLRCGRPAPAEVAAAATRRAACREPGPRPGEGCGKRRTAKRPRADAAESAEARPRRHRRRGADAGGGGLPMLMPKRVKHRKVQRGRRAGLAKGGTSVSFGDFGLMAEEVCWLTSRQIEAARRAMTHHIKRGGRVWIRVFPDKPVTKKPAEVRMGSGKGAPDHWVAVVKPGRVMFEMSGVPEPIAREAMRLAGHKLPISTKFVVKEGLEHGHQ